MKKRRIIVISCIIGIIVILVGIFAAMFNLQHITVEIKKNPEIVLSYGEDVGDKIIKTGDFPYDSNTLFSSYKDNQEKIEKNFPFVKVEKLVRRFPNKMTIYVSGRIPEAIVKNKSSYYVLDIDLKILAVISSVSELDNDMYKGLPIVEGIDMSGLSSGDFLEKSEGSELVAILDGIYAKDKTKSSVMSRITINKQDNLYSIVLRDSNVDGAKIDIKGSENLKEKVFCAYSLYKFKENDSRYPDKSKMSFYVGLDFVINTNEKVVMKYDGTEVNV